MSTIDTTKKALDQQLERIAWGLFLIMIGGLALVPGSTVPEGTWLIGTGLIMLGLNAARSLNGIPMSGFTIVLGLIALGSGISTVFGVSLPVLPIILIVIGVHILYKIMVQER